MEIELRWGRGHRDHLAGGARHGSSGARCSKQRIQRLVQVADELKGYLGMMEPADLEGARVYAFCEHTRRQPLSCPKAPGGARHRAMSPPTAVLSHPFASTLRAFRNRLFTMKPNLAPDPRGDRMGSTPCSPLGTHLDHHVPFASTVLSGSSAATSYAFLARIPAGTRACRFFTRSTENNP